MAELLAVAIGIGLVVALLFSEFFGLAAGGLVVPGYFALYLNQPVVLFITIGAALLTYLIVTLIGRISIVYGKRRTVMMILTGYVVRMFFDSLFNKFLVGTSVHVAFLAETDISVIGYIIPGLIAIWMDRQGIVETLSTLVTASVLVRLALMLVFGTELGMLFPQTPV